MSSESTTSGSFIGGLYWRGSPIDGRKAEPVIMSLGDGVLALDDRQGAVFSVPVASVRVRFKTFGTIVLEHSGTTYVFDGAGAPVSPTFTRAQVERLVAAGRTAPLIRSPLFEFRFRKLMYGHTRPWREPLRQAGATVV